MHMRYNTLQAEHVTEKTQMEANWKLLMRKRV